MATFLQQLEAQPWYQSVAQIFAQAKVPAPLWESTIAVEDASLDPNAHNFNAATGDNSFGLFQINLYGDLGTDPARVKAAYGSPTDQATWAAQKMSAALARVPAGSNLPTQLQAIEKAGWPGNLSEDPQRQKALADITGSKPDIFHFFDPQANGQAAGAAVAASIPDAINNFTTSVQDLAQGATLAAIGLALVAAGAALWASGSPTVRAAAKGAALA